MIILRNNLSGTLVINQGFEKPLIIDAGGRVEASEQILFHPQIQSLLTRKILTKIEK